MKGPGLRIDLDVRRVWQCPKCGRQMHCDGEVTSRVCFCQKEETFMLLVGETKPAAPRSECRENPPPQTGPSSSDNEIQPRETVAESDFGSGISATTLSPLDDAPGRLPESGPTESQPG